MKDYLDIFVCPKCKSSVNKINAAIVCTNSICKSTYPVYNNTPILINEDNSLFTIQSFETTEETTFSMSEERKGSFGKWMKKLVPSISHNLAAEKNYAYLLNELIKANNGDGSVKKVLIIGGGIAGRGMDKFLSSKQIEIIETDVSYGPRTQIICDSHDLPFADKTFDLVIAQAVLEHVVDPIRCVSEIHRVLATDAMVYAETPFMQQVHMRQYDFTRYTHLGHRRLFRNFTEMKSGCVAGPGTSLAWAYSYFIMSFASNRLMKNILKTFAYSTSFFLKYFDYLLKDKPGGYDAASIFYFMGKKSNTALDDKELIKAFKGI
ncbi:methyltransferase domain-containing protein [Ferruginibacter sp. SUN002]|uniref:methyltransferase domain-containing protein n=1 Tax=Ferruginibacter sp. SUN002 TaxID=2937789 RepID=UPI003D36CCEC